MPWALLLVWWGVLELTPTRPPGLAALGVGIILLGVNGLRAFTGSIVNRCSVALGLVALALGAMSAAEAAWSFELPTLPILLIAAGAALVACDTARERASGPPQVRAESTRTTDALS